VKSVKNKQNRITNIQKPSRLFFVNESSISEQVARFASRRNQHWVHGRNMPGLKKGIKVIEE
jgi:hypothetical protein